MSYYLNKTNSRNRLLKEYLAHGKLIIACDFDDTVYNTYEKDWEYDTVLELLRRWNDYAEIIVWTGHKEDEWDKIRKHFLLNGVKIKGINVDSCAGDFGRKIYANAYLDDRAGLRAVYEDLEWLIDKIEKGDLKNE